MEKSYNTEINEISFNILKHKNVEFLINQITAGNLIVLVIKSSCVIIQKFSWGYEINTISRSHNSTWETMKCNDYSLRVTLFAIFQSKSINKTLIYLCKCNGENMIKQYIKIADSLLLVDNKGKKTITFEKEMEEK